MGKKATQKNSKKSLSIAKGDGNAPVQAYIAATSGWKQRVCRRIDELIMEAAPKSIKAVKWNSPSTRSFEVRSHSPHQHLRRCTPR